MLSRALLLPPLPIPQDPPLQTLLRTNHNPASSITNNPDQIRFSHIIIQSYTSPMSRDDSRLQLSSHNVISCKMLDKSSYDLIKLFLVPEKVEEVQRVAALLSYYIMIL